MTGSRRNQPAPDGAGVSVWRSRFVVLQGILPVHWPSVPLDILAGITLASLAIPEVMGYTSIAGMPVVTGLYTILIPVFIFAVLGSSRHLVIGADSATAAILASGLVGMAAHPASDRWVALAGAVALMAGFWLIFARFARLGFISDFLSNTVLVGFLTGVGIQVAAGQIAAMLGIEGSGLGPIQSTLADLKNISSADATTILVSSGVLIVAVGGRLLSHKIPGALVAVLGSIVAGYFFDLRSHGVALVGAVHGGLPPIGIPAVSLTDVVKLIPLSLSIFVVIIAQSAATSRAYATKYGESFNEDTDLIGLGVASLGAGLSGTFPINGSPTKTQMVDDAGGRTQIAQLTTGLIVLLVLLFLTGPLAYMPVATLAAVVFVIGIELVDIAGMKRIYKQRPVEFWVALITALTVVFVGVEQGIILAIILSLLVHTRHGYHPKNGLLAKARGTSGATETYPIDSNQQAAPGLAIYRFAHDMYYANADTLSSEVLDIVKTADPKLRWFCIDLTSVTDVDYTAAATLAHLVNELNEEGVRLVFSHATDGVRHGLDVSGITNLVGDDAYFPTTGSVIRAYVKDGNPGPGNDPAEA